jgi:hypothetical protein
MQNVTAINARAKHAATATSGLEEVIRSIVRAEIESALEDLDDRPAPVGPPPLIDRKALATALAVSLPTIDRLREKGLPTIMVCDAPRFDLAQVRAWLATGEGVK